MSRAGKDLTSITQSLSAATSDDNILDILKQMNALPPALSFTLELLKSTRCGKVVGAIKKSTKNDTIKALAKEIIAKMKKAASTQGYTQTKKVAAPKPTTSATTTIQLTAPSDTKTDPSTSTSSSSTSSTSTSTKTTTAPTTTQPESLKTTGNPSRDHIVKKFYAILKVPVTGEEAAWPTNEKLGTIAVQIEGSINKKANVEQRPRDYMALLKRLTFNLQNNGVLRGQVANSTIPAFVLVQMDPKLLATKGKKIKSKKKHFQIHELHGIMERPVYSLLIINLLLFLSSQKHLNSVPLTKCLSIYIFFSTFSFFFFCCYFFNFISFSIF